MFTLLPPSSEVFERLRWSEVEPWYGELTATRLSQETLQPWLAQWSRLSELVDETMVRQEIAVTQDTFDVERANRRRHFLAEIYSQTQSSDQQLKQQLVVSGLEPENFLIPLRNLRAEEALFREVNLPLLNEEQDLVVDFMRIGGMQTIMWEGQEVNIASLEPLLSDPNREQRERAWRVMHQRQLTDRDAMNALWTKGMHLRQQIAHNAGYDTYRDYRWQQLFRFDYTPADCQTFCEAVEQVIVPAAQDVWKKRRKLLRVHTLRPWDLVVDPRRKGNPHLFSDVPAAIQQATTAFGFIDPQVQSYFETMLQEHLIDMEERPAKAYRGYCVTLEATHRPFLFGEVQSLWDLVFTLFHESGHAFHTFEMRHLPYIQQRKESFVPVEFAEVASTSMEVIGAMYLHQAGFCTQREEDQLRLRQLERILTQLLPQSACGDAFQQWVYTHPEQAMNPEACDQKWVELSGRYMPSIDWSGLDPELRAEWQQVRHFYGYPFYYIEYAFAALEALQVWRNYLRNPHGAMQTYRSALALGATKTVPELFAAAGATFSFDAATLQETLQVVTQTVTELETRAEDLSHS